MVDLKPFCSDDPFRYYLAEPFSQGDFTYAMDGCIAVRVARRADVSEVEKAPKMSNLPWGRLDENHSSFLPLRVSLPDTDPVTKCAECNGTGTWKCDCPACYIDHECEECDGTGSVSNDVAVSVPGHNEAFALRYIRLLTTLPGIKISSTPVVDDALPFQFDGGCGLLMRMRDRSELEAA